MTRISREELANSMAKAKGGGPAKIAPDDRECVAFTKDGQEVEEKNPDVFLKAVRLGENITYWVMRGPSHRLYNPYDDLIENEERRYRHKDGFRQRYELSKTTQKVFDLYLRYLETRNTAYLTNAQREE